MRTLVMVALCAAALGAGAGSASAYCDPKYYPLCTNDCQMAPPDLKDPVRDLYGRACPE